MKLIRSLQALALLLLLAAASQAAPALAPFPDHTRYAAVGDSITHRGLYSLYVHLYYLTRFPQRDIELFDIGVSGDSASGGLKRLSWDILPTRPTVATVMFGMNDVNRGNYAPDKKGEAVEAERRKAIDAYEANVRELAQKLKAEGIQVILVLPSIYDDTSTMDVPNLPGVNAALEECAKRVTAIAAELDLPVLDFQHPMHELNLKLQAQDPAFTMIGKDRVHPQQPGHLFMAYQLLKAQHAPAEVAAVSLDAATGKVTQNSGCDIDQVQTGKKGLRFRYSAHALPFPVEEEAKTALEWVPSFTDDLNRETLQITGLTAGAYELSMDGKPVRRCTAAELAQGVNLATEPAAPGYQQAQKVLGLVKQRWGLMTKLRDIVMVEFFQAKEEPRPVPFDLVKPLVETRLKALTDAPKDSFMRRMYTGYLENKPKEDEIRAQRDAMLPVIRAAAQPQPHLVSITPVQP